MDYNDSLEIDCVPLAYLSAVNGLHTCVLLAALITPLLIHLSLQIFARELLFSLPTLQASCIELS